jgi:hypothetical protein
MIDHARILNAYLCGLTGADLDSIEKSAKYWAYCSMNENTKECMQARAGFYAVVCNAVNNLMEHNKTYINQVLTEELEIRQ